MKKYLIVTLITLTVFSCKKKNEDAIPDKKDLTGKVDLQNSLLSDIIIVSESDNANVSNEGTFNINLHSVLLAKSKTTNNPVYFGFPGVDEVINYNLDAKETALYFSLSAFPNIRRQYYKTFVKKIKQAIYQYQEVKNLELKIKQSITQRGYLDYDLIGPEIGLAIDKILTTTKAETSTFTANRVVIDPTYSATGGYYRVSDEIPPNWTDQFDANTNTYKVKRKMYNTTAAIVGVQIGKHNRNDNSATLSNKFIGFIEPYYPPNLASVDGTISNLEQAWEATYDLVTNGWNGLTNTDAYSKDNEFIFDAKKDEKDAVIFVNGYYNPQVMRGINVAYIFMDNLQDILEKANGGNNLFSKQDFVNDFFKSIVDDATNVNDLANYYVWFKDKNYDLIIDNLKQKLESYLLQINTTEAKIELDFLKDYIDKSFKIIAGGWAKTYKYSRLAYKIASMILISDSKKFAGFSPIEFDNLSLPLSPYQPSPFNVNLNNVTTINFQWLIKNPQSQTLKYNVYLSNTISGLKNNKIATDITSTNFNYNGSLVANTRYYWQVEVTNQFNEKRLGAIWTFDNGNSISQSSQGLVAYYPFNGNVNDESTNAFNGIIYGATLTTDRKGNANKAYLFNGTSNYIEIPHSNYLNLPDEISISVWINASNVSNSQRIFDKTTVGLADAYMIDIHPSKQIRLIVANPPAGSNPPQSTAAITQNNTWYHIVATYDKSNVRFYINGTLDRVYPITGVSTPNNNPLRIGANSQLNGNWFQGKIDDIRLYNRVLNESDISALYTE